MHDYGAVLYQSWYLTGQDVPSEDGFECTCQRGHVICQPIEGTTELNAQVLDMSLKISDFSKMATYLMLAYLQ